MIEKAAESKALPMMPGCLDRTTRSTGVRSGPQDLINWSTSDSVARKSAKSIKQSKELTMVQLSFILLGGPQSLPDDVNCIQRARRARDDRQMGHEVGDIEPETSSAGARRTKALGFFVVCGGQRLMTDQGGILRSSQW
jgi:hypothetical protein